MRSGWTAAVSVFLSLALHALLIGALRHCALTKTNDSTAELEVRSVVLSTSTVEEEGEPVVALSSSTLPTIEVTAPDVKDADRPEVEVKLRVTPPICETETMPAPLASIEPLTIAQPAPNQARVEAHLATGVEIRPSYPRGARRRGEQGTVTVQAVVDDAGKVLSAKVVSSPGFKDLESAAITAVMAASFIPAKSDGCSVVSSVIIPIVFRLQ